MVFGVIEGGVCRHRTDDELCCVLLVVSVDVDVEALLGNVVRRFVASLAVVIVANNGVPTIPVSILKLDEESRYYPANWPHSPFFHSGDDIKSEYGLGDECGWEFTDSARRQFDRPTEIVSVLWLGERSSVGCLYETNRVCPAIFSLI